MKTVISIFLFFTFVLISQGQVTTATSDGRNNPVPGEVQNAEAAVARTLAESGNAFREGLTAVLDERRSQSREKFDKSIEAFLISGINFNVIEGLRANICYNFLIETVYRIEFPNQSEPPQIALLSSICGWNIDNDLSDKVVKFVLTIPKIPQKNNSVLATVVPINQLNNSPFGFTEQKFEPSPLDELAKYIPSKKDEKSKVNSTTYIRPTTPLNRIDIRPTSPNQDSRILGVFRIVKAVSGDTVAKIAQRYGVNPVDVANLNGFVSINSKLTAGREVRIPVLDKNSIVSPQQSDRIVIPGEKGLGVKPKQFKDGKVQAVIDYFNENLDDPYSMRLVRWSAVTPKVYGGNSYWSVQVKFRAKNRLGAYVLSEMIFYIRNNKVIWTQRL